MTRSRHLLAGTLLPLVVAAALSGCGATPARPAAAAPPVTSAAPAAPVPEDTSALLDSSPATLDALRADDARRPVSVLVPGVAKAAPVQERTTDPVTGGLDLPTGAATVAWWASGATPGSPAGSVVLAAHVSYDGQTGPFTRLAGVAPGTQVQVTSADGSVHAYAVQSTRNSPKGSLDRAQLFRTTGPPALVLVTCGGPYDRATHSFEENVVVTAVPA